MADKVHFHPKFKKQLTAMKSQTNAPSIAADRAGKIIEAMIKGRTSQASGLFRARSDTRVKNSWKYDLGAGYRLICIRTKQNIYVMHIGDHESCDTWLKNNSKKQPQKTEIKMTTFTIRENSKPFDFKTVRSPERNPDFDDQYLRPIPQEYLRKVFCGLVAG
nr:type II toxin-antitoxin system RelE/ParE family toxin [uncultured Desulfobacter sp.]